jgi:hypothetical protein
MFLETSNDKASDNNVTNSYGSLVMYASRQEMPEIQHYGSRQPM